MRYAIYIETEYEVDLEVLKYEFPEEWENCEGDEETFLNDIAHETLLVGGRPPGVQFIDTNISYWTKLGE